MSWLCTCNNQHFSFSYMFWAHHDSIPTLIKCMDNEHTMYYSNGEFCDSKSSFEDYESKYTPGVWDSADLFDSMEECCANKFWWDIPGCKASSPKEFSFQLSFDLCGLTQPEICQDADTIANALETAMDIGLDSDSESNVTSIGCATLTRNADTGNTGEAL